MNLIILSKQARTHAAALNAISTNFDYFLPPEVAFI
jgi:hypothetical protein